MPLRAGVDQQGPDVAAALLTLDRQARISTRVVAGSPNAQGPIVLVGAGDPTLSAAPPGRTHLVPGFAAHQRPGGAGPPQRGDTDGRAGGHLAFTGPTMAQGWDPGDVDNGDIAPIESVMIDAGRIQPTHRRFEAVANPGAGCRAGAGQGPRPGSRCGDDRAPRRPARGSWPSVQSAPLVQRLSEMMDDSDNVLAECIAPRGGGRDQAAAEASPARSTRSPTG